MYINRRFCVLSLLIMLASHVCLSIEPDDIFTAAKMGNITRLKELLAQGVDINKRDADGFTALHIAAINGKVEVIRLFIEHGGNVDVLDGDNHTPLHFAAYNGENAAIKLLLAHGASIDV